MQRHEPGVEQLASASLRMHCGARARRHSCGVCMVSEHATPPPHLFCRRSQRLGLGEHDGKQLGKILEELDR